MGDNDTARRLTMILLLQWVVQGERMLGSRAIFLFVLTNGNVRVFMAILFTSGYATLPIRRICTRNAPFHVHNETVAKAMNRDRFEEILCYLHIADSMHLEPTDKFSKVRPLITELNKINYFSSSFQCNSNFRWMSQ